MGWFKVDDQLAFHQKAVIAGNAAMGLWVRAGSWSCAQLTDGFIAKAMANAMANECDADALVLAGLWDEVEGGYQFHDWAEFQPSAEDEREKRKARSLAGKKGAAARWSNKTDGKPHSKSHGKNMRSQCPDPDPDPYTEAKASGTPDSETEITREDAGAIISQWIESQAQRPPSRVIGQLSKEIKTLLDEGHPFEEVLSATQAWSRKSLHPSTLASVLHEIRNPRTMTAGAEQRMQVGMSLIERVAAKGKGGLDFDPFEQKEIES